MGAGRGLAVHHARRTAGAEQPVLLPTAALRERLMSEAEAQAEARTSFLEWALRIPEPKTGTLDFNRYPFQRELYELGADAHEAVVMKGTQVGVSTYLIRWSMYWPDMKSMTSLYVFPKKAQLRDFSQGRVRPLVKAEGSYLQSRVPADNIDNSMMKQIGLGLVYFRGSEVKDDLDSVDADTIAFDEYDRLNQKNVEDAEHRVDASPLGLLRRIGNPTVEEFGIAGHYEASDQRRWNVKCGACNEWQDLSYDGNVDEENVAVVCRRCRKPLDVRQGEWVAKHPSREVFGYHVSRLMVPGINLRKVVQNAAKTDTDARGVHMNKDLGLPYTSSEQRLTMAHLAAAQTIGGRYETEFTYGGDKIVTAGIDVASKRNLNVRISEWTGEGDAAVKRCLWVGECSRFLANDDGDGDLPSVEELMNRYRVNFACADHEPEYLAVQRLANHFPGRVFIARYATQNDMIRVDIDAREVILRRTEAIDRMMDRMRAQKNHLPMTLPPTYGEQMRANVRVVTENDKGQRVARYEKVGKFDDYAHAEVYDEAAWDGFRVVREVMVLAEDTYEPLDDLMDFDRSEVNQGGSLGYSAGPEESMGGYEDTGMEEGW